MMTVAKAKPVPEEKAAGRVERLFHEIKQTLRVTGVPLNFRLYAGYERFFPAMWEAMRPNCETRAFEEAGDVLRSEAVHAAAGMERLSVLGRAQLGESQAYQAENALRLYHYVNPKLLVFTTALKLALEGKAPRGCAAASAELIERGAPSRMPPMEMVDESPEDELLRKTFRDIKRTLGADPINSDYRTLALWPRYLAVGWQRLKPLIRTEGYKTTCARLIEHSQRAAAALPLPVTLDIADLARDSEEYAAVLAQTRRIEELLPPLILNVALLTLDWQAPELARRSPFPARPRPAGEAR